MPVKPIPEGSHTVTPYLVVNQAGRVIDFLKQAFGAEESERFLRADGTIMHAELKIGDSMIMLSDEFPEMGARPPQSVGGTPAAIHLYVENVDTIFDRAVTGGGKEIRPVDDKFYGDRTGTLQDPFGHVWHVATHKEDVAPDELKKRADAAMKKMHGKK